MNVLNRAWRRALGRPKPLRTVRLSGGPMANWLVTETAVVLRSDWWTTWPDSIAARNRPGHYVRVADDRATWSEHDA